MNKYINQSAIKEIGMWHVRVKNSTFGNVSAGTKKENVERYFTLWTAAWMKASLRVFEDSGQPGKGSAISLESFLEKPSQ